MVTDALSGVQPVVEYGTGLLRTRIRTLPSETFEWTRTPGPLAPEPFSRGPLPPGDLRAPGSQGFEVALGDPAGSARTYRTRGDRALATDLLVPGPEPVDAAQILHDLGRWLAEQHEVLVPRDGLGAPAPRPLRRLRGWVRSGGHPGRADEALALVRDACGPQGWQRLLAEIASFSTGRPSWLHGSPGLGSVVVGRGPATLLLGEDTGVGSWRWDAAWAVGEIVEMQWQTQGRTRGDDTGVSWQHLLDSFEDGYGRPLGEDLPTLAAVRILLHLHDFSAYVCGSRAAPVEVERHSLSAYAGFVAALMAQDGGER